MTDEEKRISIAEACGVANRFVLLKKGFYYRPNGNGYTFKIENAWILSEEEADKHVYPRGGLVTKQRVPPPDYLNDLNAIHDAEKTLSIDETAEYDVHLRRFVERWYWHATARQRAEAFLRVIEGRGK